MQEADEAMLITWPGLSTIIYGWFSTEEELCLLWAGVEVVGVRGSGEWLGVEMGDPVGVTEQQLLKYHVPLRMEC